MKNEKVNNLSKVLFTLAWLVVGYLQTSCYTFGHKIISYVLWPTLLIGAVAVFINLLHYKDYLKDKKLYLLIFFCFSFLISAVVMHKYGMYQNIRILIFIAFQFFVLYLYNTHNKIQDNNKILDIILNVFLVGTFILTLISFIQLFTGYSKVIIKVNEPNVVFGFTWGRLFGAYWDPNIASVICCVSLSILINRYLRTTKVWAKVAYGLFAVMQLFYIVLSDSRTGRICLIACIVSYVLFYFIKLILNKKSKKIENFYAKMTISVVIALLFSIYTPMLIKQVYNEIAATNTKSIEQKESSSGQDSQSSQTIGRGYDIKKDISNRRFEIWLSGLEIFMRNPIVGVSRQNIVAYASEHMPETYIVNNSQMDFDSMHNLYVDVIVSQGLLGFIPFMLFLLLSAISIIRNLPLLFSKSDNTLMIISILLTVVTSTLVITEIIYVDSPISTVFWSSLGYLNHICLSKKK